MQTILERAVTLIGSIFLIGIALTTLFGATARYLFDQPIFGMSDIVVVMMVLVVAGSVSLAALRNEHIEMTIPIFRWVKMRAALVLRSVSTAIVSAICAYALMDQACGFERACITGDVSISHYSLYWVLASAFALLSACSVASASKQLRKRKLEK
jgi:TRAP-type C4-dicarboxylate transport system permease small subunit